jgi:hypothetical protein
MKRLLLALGLLGFLMGAAFADGNGGDTDIDDMFGGGTDEFEFERFSDDRIMVAIDQDAAINCDSAGLCTLSAVTTNSRTFTVNFNIGEGNNASGGFGGFGEGNGGTTINLGDSENGDASRGHWGVNIQYKVGTCTQKVKVPRALFYSMNRYLYGLMGAEGSVRRGFTPADEAMILFYTTILNKASGCGN